MDINEPPTDADLIYSGQPWIKAAIAQQEEHLRRIRSCTGASDQAEPVPGLAHSWDHFSPAPSHETYEACWRCRVTRTNDDYQRKTASGPTKKQ